MRRSTGRRGERRKERNIPAIPQRSDGETTSVAGRATPDKPSRAEAPPRAAVGLEGWRAIRQRSPLQIYLRPACGPAAHVGRRSIPPAVASRQWSLLSGGRSLQSHWALFEILQQTFVACFQGRVPRHRAAERAVLRPQRLQSPNRPDSLHEIENIWPRDESDVRQSIVAGGKTKTAHEERIKPSGRQRRAEHVVNADERRDRPAAEMFVQPGAVWDCLAHRRCLGVSRLYRLGLQK